VLGVVSSDGFIAAVVLGVPIVVATLVVLSSTGRLRGPGLASVAAVGVLVIGVIVYGVFRTTGPTTATASSGPQGGSGSVIPPVVSPTPVPSSSAPPTPTGPPSAPCSPSGTTVNETAKSIAFGSDCLAAPANTAFTIQFDNQDAGIPHNIHIFQSDPSQDPNAPSLFMGDLVTGPKTATYQVSALTAGTYFFHCDVHPTQMTGTFVVK